MSTTEEIDVVGTSRKRVTRGRRTRPGLRTTLPSTGVITVETAELPDGVVGVGDHVLVGDHDAEPAVARVLDVGPEAAEGFPPDQIGEPRPGPGRPPLPDGETRSESIVVRITPGDKARLVALADATDQAQSHLVRSALHRLFAAHDLLGDEGSAEEGHHAPPSVASTPMRLHATATDR